ncbi:MAG: hypothetical protein ABIA67_00420 [Candidatus Margulisiibacteriota bacterium]
MMYFVFTIDGDWDEYFNIKLSDEQRKPKKDQLLALVRHEIELAASTLNGKFIHFVHTSPLAKDSFLKPEFISLWKEVEAGGGEVGIHCHEEDLYQAWHYDNQERMESTIGFEVDELNKNGLSPKTYRGGFMTFSPKVIPILEENGIFLDFSCDPGRHLKYGDSLVSDWQGAPDNFYRMSYDDHRRPGDSKVFEIPLGIYIEKRSLWSIWRKARKLKKKKELQILSVMAHTYDFVSWKMRLKIKLALLILKKYGKFIDTVTALNIINEQEQAK